MCPFPRKRAVKFNGLPPMHSLRIRTKLLIALLPLTIVILVATGVATNWFSSQFLNEAIQRNVQIRTLALAHELEGFLNQCREDILELRQGPVTEAALSDFWRAQQNIRGWGYAGIAYLTVDPDKCIYLVGHGKDVVAIPSGRIPEVRPDPRSVLSEIPSTDQGVWISQIVEASYPIASREQFRSDTAKKIIRFTTLVKREGRPDGLLVLAVSVFQLRDILTMFNSPQSPIFDLIRSPALRYSFLFGLEGWLWFQSEDTLGKGENLSSRLARRGLSGTFGKLGFSAAFKPAPEYGDYWHMVNDVREGKAGLIRVKESDPSLQTDRYYMGYAPVRFQVSSDRNRVVFAGVAFVDHSRLGMWAGFRQIDVIFVIALASTLFLSLLISVLSWVITRPIFELAAEVDRAQETGELQEIELPDRDYETSHLIRSINGLFTTIRTQVEEIRLKEEQLLDSSQRERVRLEEEIRMLKSTLLLPDFQEILGLSPAIESLKMDILKAASVEADVLILGETGTGKQLAAEALHRLSCRAGKRFVSINCGALDENLLMDELFGHKKGAFTEARSNRRGAFLAADGGVLFLDEIGAASARVQQSLLRALAIRRITPLGSDSEYDIDVRVVAATNEDLRAMVEQGRFRNDLYYRLRVITIRTPALRDHREDIPILANHFLKMAALQMEKEDIGLTRGALEKLKAHDWPGNVRELRNCIMGAVAMAESSLIHSGEIELDKADDESAAIAEFEGIGATEAVSAVPTPDGVFLNERQKCVIPFLQNRVEISRQEYQQIIGGELAARTAVYDLQDLVRKGVLEMTGRGPATRYRLGRAKRE